MSIQPQTPFERWWLERIRARKFREYIAQRDLVLAMDAVLQGLEDESDKKRIRMAKPEELASFSQTNVDLLQSRAGKTISRSIPAELAPRIVSSLKDAPENWWQLILDGMSVQDAARLAEQIYHYYPAPPERELAPLEHLATQSQFKPLMCKVAFWRRAKRPAAWGKLLREMSLEDYSAMGKELIKSPGVGLFDWLCDQKIDAWLVMCLPILSSSQVVDAATYLISGHRGDLLELLAPKVESMSRAEQVALEKLIKEHAGLAPGLWSRILTATEDKSWTANLLKNRRENSSDKRG